MSYKAFTRVLGLMLLVFPGTGPVHARGTDTPLTQVPFQLRSSCDCASCGFALQDDLRKIRGVARVGLSARERILTVTFDEEQVPLSRVAAATAKSELGKQSALIGDLMDARTPPQTPGLAQVPGVRSYAVDSKRKRLLVELTEEPSLTTKTLAAALATAGVLARFDAPPARK